MPEVAGAPDPKEARGGTAGDPSVRHGVAEVLWVSADVTLAVGVIAAALPSAWHATLVALVFLGASWDLVWRHDDAFVQRAGLSLGGIVTSGRLQPLRALRAASTAVGWALAAAAIVALPFFIGWRLWWAPRLAFALSVRPEDAASEAMGQLLVIALPEEAFYRGYVQSRFDDAWPPRFHILGAAVGPGLVVGAAIFAAGHLITIPLPARLAVFFPALLFGWLRARTGGIGASVVLHAFCNIYSQLLGRGYGLY